MAAGVRYLCVIFILLSEYCVIISLGINLISQDLGCQENKCLVLYQTKLNSGEATKTCKSAKGNLLTLTSDIEFNEVARTLDTFGIKRAWIGARFKSTKGITSLDCSITRNRNGPRCGTFSQNVGCNNFHETVCTTGPSSTRGNCRAGFEQLHGYCIFLNKTRVTWYKARQTCLSLDADLVTSESYLFSYLTQGDKYRNLERLLSSIRRAGTRSGRRLLGVPLEEVIAVQEDIGSGGSGDGADDLRRPRIDNNKGRKPPKTNNPSVLPWTRCASDAWIWNNDMSVDLQTWAVTGPAGPLQTCLTMNKTRKGDWLLEPTRCRAFSAFICQQANTNHTRTNIIQTTPSMAKSTLNSEPASNTGFTSRGLSTSTDNFSDFSNTSTHSEEKKTSIKSTGVSPTTKSMRPSTYTDVNTAKIYDTQPTTSPYLPKLTYITPDRHNKSSSHQVMLSTTPSGVRQANTATPKQRVIPRKSTTLRTTKRRITAISSVSLISTSSGMSSSTQSNLKSTTSSFTSAASKGMEIGDYAAIIISVSLSLFTLVLVAAIFIRIRIQSSRKRKQKDGVFAGLGSGPGSTRESDNHTEEEEAIYATIDNDTSPHLASRSSTPDIVNSCSVGETSFSVAPYHQSSRRDYSHSELHMDIRSNSHTGQSHSPHTSIRYASSHTGHTAPSTSRVYQTGYQDYPHPPIRGQTSNFSNDSGISMARQNSSLSGSYRSPHNPVRPDYLEVLPDTNNERRYKDHIENAQNPHNFINYTNQQKPAERYLVSHPSGSDSWSWQNVAPLQHQQRYQHGNTHNTHYNKY